MVEEKFLVGTENSAAALKLAYHQEIKRFFCDCFPRNDSTRPKIVHLDIAQQLPPNLYELAETRARKSSQN
jgi:hypothetical protein